MKFIPQAIPDVILIEPKVFGDQRGYFVETFRQDLFEQAVGRPVNFIQDNESKSSRGVLRGLHYQLEPYAQAKLVRVVSGEVLDVVVDLRKSSPTFGQHVRAILNDHNKHQIFIPHGFAHGFLVLSEEAVFSYKVDNSYSPEHEYSVRWNDPKLGIDWHGIEPILSTKDAMAPELNDIPSNNIP